MAAHLPPASLPLRFELPSSLRGQASATFSSTALSPCITTFLNGFTLYRTLDPGSDSSWVSLARLFLACGITVAQGLFRFETKYASTDLGGMAPFTDIWIQLDRARTIAEELGCDEELAGLLDARTARAWVVLDYESENEDPSLLFNWRIPPNSLQPTEYSHKAMLNTTFPCLLMTKADLQVRTQLDTGLIQAVNAKSSKSAPSFDALFTSLALWTNLLHSLYTEEGSAAQGHEPEKHFRSQLWSTLASMLQLNTNVQQSSSSGLSDNAREYLIGANIVNKSDAANGSLLGQLAIIDMLTLLLMVMKSAASKETESAIDAAQRHIKHSNQPGKASPQNLELQEMSDRIDPLERDLQMGKTSLQESNKRIEVLETAFLLLKDTRQSTKSGSDLPTAVSHQKQPMEAHPQRADWLAYLLLYIGITIILSQILSQAGFMHISIPHLKMHF